MIENSFVFLEGIGLETERKLWEQGVSTWGDFLSQDVVGISSKRKGYYDRKLVEAKKALQRKDVGYFSRILPQREMWRLYGHFSCCFLDIEVDGAGEIIVVTLFDKFESKTLVRGMHLERGVLLKELSQYGMLVTYNGSAFDIPKIEKFIGKKLAVPHIDLKALCHRLGLKGGLKEVERQLGIIRPQHLQGSAVDAWKAYLASGDREYLELLVEYNEADAVNLHQLVEKCLGRVLLRF
jgi:uncharacterized protein